MEPAAGGGDLAVPDVGEAAEQVGRLAEERGWTVACAESLTSGAVASALGAAPRASEWFAGGVVAYTRHVKHAVLGVPDGPVVSRGAALAMASGVAGLLEADLVVALTGAGGPDSQDGQPPGTVWFAVCARDQAHAEERRFDGDPEEVLASATAHAIALLRQVVSAAPNDAPEDARR